MTQVPGSSQQQAYEYIKRQIFDLVFKPGSYVIDSQVAAALGVSRTPVREALYRLESEGLLSNVARRGWRVYSLTLDDIHAIFDIKVAVEGMVAGKAAACRDEALRTQLVASLEAMAAAVMVTDAAAWLAADVDFHRVLFAMAKNNRAERMIANLNDQWHRLRIGFMALEGRMARSTTEHQAVVAAVLAMDAAAAETTMRSHLNQVRAELVNLLANLVLPFVDEGV